MKQFIYTPKFSRYYICFLLLCTMQIAAQNDFVTYKGRVLDARSNKPLEAVNLNITDTNISTITNSEGDFLLKAPQNYTNKNIVISLLGYKSKTFLISKFRDKNVVIKLNEAVTELSTVNISAYKDAASLVRHVFNTKNKTIQNELLYMTAFYRETIKRRNRNVSLTEAIVDIVKQPSASDKKDVVTLGKARKSTDYKRLDTVSVKLQGGPFSTLYLDIMKYPEYIFTKASIETYKFSFDPPSTINNAAVYVVDFRPKNRALNLNYIGKLYIDVKTTALVSAKYTLDLSDKKKAKNLLVKRKPRNVEVYPLEASYRVDYKSKDHKWYYNYSTLFLKFKINKKRELFNKVYSLASEMVVTNWEISDANKKIKAKERLKPTVIITDAISGFSDPDFWGQYNLIEPDKSIESAIHKIKKSITRNSENKR